MTAPSSPEAPWPVRTVARKVAEWIGRLGEVWVEGQVAQLSRRGGAATVFLKPFRLEALVQTLRDLLDGWNFPLGWPEPAHEPAGLAAARNIPPFDAARSSPQLHAGGAAAEPENSERYNPRRTGPWH